MSEMLTNRVPSGANELGNCAKSANPGWFSAVGVTRGGTSGGGGIRIWSSSCFVSAAFALLSFSLFRSRLLLRVCRCWVGLGGGNGGGG